MASGCKILGSKFVWFCICSLRRDDHQLIIIIPFMKGARLFNMNVKY